MKPVFDPDLLKKAIATPGQIKEAEKHGAPFWHEDPAAGIGVRGYMLNGIVYITDIKNLNPQARVKEAR